MVIGTFSQFLTIAEQIKGLLESKDVQVDVEQEIKNMTTLVSSLRYVVPHLSTFCDEYLMNDSLDIQSEEDGLKLLTDLTKALALIQASKYLFRQSHLGKIVVLSLDAMYDALEKTFSVVRTETASASTRLGMIADGQTTTLKDIKMSIRGQLEVLAMHRDHWDAILDQSPTTPTPEVQD